MKTYDRELMARRDAITDHMRNLGMRCLSQLDMTKPSGGATLFLEYWFTQQGPGSSVQKAVLLMVDKWGGVNTYRPLNHNNNMEMEKAAITDYVTAEDPQARGARAMSVSRDLSTLAMLLVNGYGLKGHPKLEREIAIALQCERDRCASLADDAAKKLTIGDTCRINNDLAGFRGACMYIVNLIRTGEPAHSTSAADPKS